MQYSLLRKEHLNDEVIRREINALAADEARLLNLVGYADSQIFAFGLKSRQGFILSAQDIVNEAIQKTLSGERDRKRKFDPKLGTMDSWLRKQIKSIVHNYYESRPVRDRVDLSDKQLNLTAEEILEYYSANSDQQGSELKSPEALVEDYELSKTIRTTILNVVQDDPDVADLVLIYEEGICEFKDNQCCASYLGWKISRVENAKKRLKRYTLGSIKLRNIYERKS